jgi:hypothetical protein
MAKVYSCNAIDYNWHYLWYSREISMSDDKVFFGTILAMFAFMTGNPFIALLIFILAIL